MAEKPKRALILVFDAGERITGEAIRERLEAKDYAILPHPTAMRADDSKRGERPMRLIGLVSVPPL